MAKSKVSDEQLVQEYKKGNNEALRLLIERYLEKIYNFVHLRVREEREAEDITQEIFIKVWRSLKKFKKGYKFRTWLFTIARNTLIDSFRKKKVISFSDLKTLDETFEEKIIDSQKEPIGNYESIEKREVIKKALSELPLKYRYIIEKYYYEELSLREVADSLAESLNTTKSKHRRALLKLKEILKKYL